MDAGIIAKIKGFVRSCYGWWATRFVIMFLGRGGKPNDVKLPLDKQSVVVNITAWLCRARAHFNSSTVQQQGIRDCWNKTRLPQAMMASVQDEAVSRIRELFKDSSPHDGYVEPGEEPENTSNGASVDEPDDPEVRTEDDTLLRKGKAVALWQMIVALQETTWRSK